MSKERDKRALMIVVTRAYANADSIDGANSCMTGGSMHDAMGTW